MARAVRLSLDIVPIAGSRYVERWWRPYWERLECIDIDDVFTILKTDDLKSELHNFMIQQIDPLKGPQLRVLILRAQNDTLCINMNHMVGDTVGLKQLVYLIASIYNDLIKNQEHIPRYAGQNRSLRHVSRHIGFSSKVKTLCRVLRGRSDTDNWRLPLSSEGSCKPVSTIRRLPKSRFNAIREYGKKYQATINDVVLAAYYRALYKLIQSASGKPMCIGVTTDLRRYIPPGETSGICNLSGFITSNIGCEIGIGFKDTLIKVRDDMNIKKINWPGLEGIIPIVALFKMLPYTIVKKVVYNIFGGIPEPDTPRLAMPPTLTNMGAIDSEKLLFNNIGIKNAYTTGAVNYPPGFQIGLSSFNKSLTFSILTCDTGDNVFLTKRLLDLIDMELPK